MDKDLLKLIHNYGKQQNQHPFLLVDLSGGKENTHTKILMSLLQFNNYMFLSSFLKDVLNVPDWNKDKDKVKITTQYPAVGLKTQKRTKGYIDLYLKYIDQQNQPHIVVIENKINGAIDTQRQMLRYIASVKKYAIKDSTKFKQWVQYVIRPLEKNQNDQNKIKGQCQNRHFVYLTLDNSKTPEDDSLPPFLLKNSIIDYNPISYQDNLLRLQNHYEDCHFHQQFHILYALDNHPQN